MREVRCVLVVLICSFICKPGHGNLGTISAQVHTPAWSLRRRQRWRRVSWVGIPNHLGLLSPSCLPPLHVVQASMQRYDAKRIGTEARGIPNHLGLLYPSCLPRLHVEQPACVDGAYCLLLSSFSTAFVYPWS